MKTAPGVFLDQIFEEHIQTLALTLRPGTVKNYRTVTRLFLGYLRAAFPQVRRLSQLRRDPHLLGWFRCLCEHDPPLCNTTRLDLLVRLRRLLDDLAAIYSMQPELIRREDLPPQTHYLPKPLTLDDDQRLQQALRNRNDLYSNALLLVRLTGIRIGECMDLALDCSYQLAPDPWVLHVPIGKLHTERLVPIDPEIRRVLTRILELRALARPTQLARSEGLLLPRGRSRMALYLTLHRALVDAAERARCSSHVSPHRLRHSYATEMLRLGVSLPALMQLLGHKTIGMTLRYVQVTQQDLLREFHQARQNASQRHHVPDLPTPKDTFSTDLPGIHRALSVTRHLLEMYRRTLSSDNLRRKLQRLDRRLLAVADLLDHIAEK
jgi:site-specific recombinase XerD